MIAWHTPPIIKLYEAIGALGDERVELAGNAAKVYSSSRNKCYDVRYDPASRSITSNDNGSYWQGYLGYPSIAYLLAVGVIRHDATWDTALAGVAWKDLNTKFKNDFRKTEEHVRAQLAAEGFDLDFLDRELAAIQGQIDDLNLGMLGKTLPPPSESRLPEDSRET